MVHFIARHASIADVELIQSQSICNNAMHVSAG